MRRDIESSMRLQDRSHWTKARSKSDDKRTVSGNPPLRGELFRVALQRVKLFFSWSLVFQTTVSDIFEKPASGGRRACRRVRHRRPKSPRPCLAPCRRYRARRSAAEPAAPGAGARGLAAP